MVPNRSLCHGARHNRFLQNPTAREGANLEKPNSVVCVHCVMLGADRGTSDYTSGGGAVSPMGAGVLVQQSPRQCSHHMHGPARWEQQVGSPLPPLDLAGFSPQHSPQSLPRTLAPSHASLAASGQELC